MIVENLGIFVEDFGETADWNGSSFKVLLDQPDELFHSDLVSSTQYVGMAISADVVGLADSDLITINGDEFKVRRVEKIEDGKLTRLHLGKV